MKGKQAWIVLLVLMLILWATAGCTPKTEQVSAEHNTLFEIKHTPEEFLTLFNLKTVGYATKLAVTIPEDWQFELGAYPEGLYWTLANEFSKDAGLDLTPLKGKTLEAWRFSLSDGLPGKGSQSRYTYPSNVILLVSKDHVVGAWLAFNTCGIGPSVNQKDLEELTGLSFEDWFYRQSLLIDTDKNKDLAALEPAQVLDAFCKAIEAGDSTRAYACMSPEEMRNALTTNLSDKRLYNPKYDRSNSYVVNLLEAKLISYELLDADNFKKITSIGDRTKIEVAATMKLKWKDDAFNSPDGIQKRFALLKKYQNGWKLLGLGTGP